MAPAISSGKGALSVLVVWNACLLCSAKIGSDGCCTPQPCLGNVERGQKGLALGLSGFDIAWE